jgi:hypothetical protein
MLAEGPAEQTVAVMRKPLLLAAAAVVAAITCGVFAASSLGTGSSLDGTPTAGIASVVGTDPPVVQPGRFADGSVDLASCDWKTDYDCMIAHLVRSVKEDGPAAALELERSYLEQLPAAYATCHSITHKVGITAGEMLGAEALQYSNTMCQRGYLHGALQGIAGTYGSVAKYIADIGTQCDTVFKNDNDLWRDCLHGLGQSTVRIDGDALESTLKLCIDRTVDESAQSACGSGLLMEYGDGSLLVAGFPSDLKAVAFAEPYSKNLAELCVSIDNAILRSECWSRVWMYEAPKYYDNPDDLDNMCALTAPGSSDRMTCYKGVGNWFERVYNQKVSKLWPPETAAEKVAVEEYVTEGCLSTDEFLDCIWGAIASGPSHLYGVYPEELIPDFCTPLTSKFNKPQYVKECEHIREEVREHELSQI